MIFVKRNTNAIMQRIVRIRIILDRLFENIMLPTKVILFENKPQAIYPWKFSKSMYKNRLFLVSFNDNSLGSLIFTA
jgi:hypothetical protein